MFNDAIINEIISAWVDDQNHPHRDRKKREIPTFEDIKKLIEEAFWASIKREEEQALTFSIVLLSNINYKDELSLSGITPLVFEFAESVEFSSRSIAKMAFSFDKCNSALAVYKTNDNTYKIWGSVYYNSSESYLSEISIGVSNNNYFRPDVLSIIATSPGSLIISRANSVIGRIESGCFNRSTPTPFNSRSLLKYISEIAPYINTDTSFQVHKSLPIVIQEILSYLEENSHGASLVIVPEGTLNISKQNFKTKYEINGDYQLELLFRELDSYSNLSPEPMEIFPVKIGYKKAIFNRIRAIARLACIDGALIITTSLKVVGFGATLKAKQDWKGNVLIGHNGFFEPKVDFPRTNHGTRHNSMIDFIGECEDSIGFVISQDGPIRAFAKHDNETIYCWPDCRVSMFI